MKRLVALEKRKNSISKLENVYKGAYAVLVGGGPSALQNDLSKLKQPGVLVMAMNNAAATVRPNLWCCVDTPSVFLESVLMDPTITKFIPGSYDKISVGGLPVYDHPNVVRVQVCKVATADEYFSTERIPYGVEPISLRTVILAAIRILYTLGVRRVYLVGVDFKMTEGSSNYSFDQDTTEGMVNSNNLLYEKANQFLTEVASLGKMEIFNTNANSGCTAFPYVSFDSAVSACLSRLPNPSNETTAGRYEKSVAIANTRRAERLAKEKQQADGVRSESKKAPLKRLRAIKKKPRSERDVVTINARRQVVVAGPSRSGAHILASWVATQLSGNVQVRNDLPRHCCNRYLNEPDLRYPVRFYTLPGVPYVKRNDDSAFVYNIENPSADCVHADPAIAAQRTDVLVILRDPFNLLASCLNSPDKFWFIKNCTKDGATSVELLKPFVALWMELYQLTLSSSSVRPVLYNKLVTSQEYRDELAEYLEVDNRTDAALAFVPENGQGSSFDGMSLNGRGTEMQVNERWKTLLQYDWFKPFIDSNPELVAASNSLFGEVVTYTETP